MNFGGVVETVVTSKEFSLEKAREVLKNETIAILGYGIQGPGQAGNLRDNGFNVIVGQRPGKTYDKAVADGWVPGKTLFSVEEAAQKGTIICMLLSDAGQIAVWPKIKQYLTPGKTLYYSHGFAINWNDRTGVVPPADIDVIMVAPKGPGHTVRSEYTIGRGVPCLVAVHQDATGRALDTGLAYAAGIGGSRAGVLMTTFKMETETYLFGEQCVLCGGVTALMKAGFETLVEAGYDPQNAYFECIHEMKLIVDLIYKGGFQMMRYSISDTAEFGDYEVGKRLITDETKKEMKKVLGEIQDGTFARNWIMENKMGRSHFNAVRRIESEQQLEQVGKEIRKLYAWNDDAGKSLDEIADAKFSK